MKNLATLFGIGNIKYFPGSVASLAVLPVFYICKSILGWYSYTLLFIILLPHVFKTCLEYYKDHGDIKNMVLDEALGVALIFIFLGKMTMLKVIISFILFRTLDILKPWPISLWQQESSGIGVVADDMLAAVIASLVASLF